MVSLIRGVLYDILDDSVEIMEIAMEYVEDWPWLHSGLDFGRERLLDCLQLVDPL